MFWYWQSNSAPPVKAFLMFISLAANSCNLVVDSCCLCCLADCIDREVYFFLVPADAFSFDYNIVLLQGFSLSDVSPLCTSPYQGHVIGSFACTVCLAYVLYVIVSLFLFELRGSVCWMSPFHCL